MKAILVIDIPVSLEHLLGEEMLLYISHKDGRYIMTENALLRPLPQEKNHSDIDEIIWDDDIYALGFNRCLHEITGETE